MSGLLVEQTLGLAQLQDSGRFGVRHLGITQGGALDWIAAQRANQLLGNAADSAVLEIPLGGLVLHCRQASTLALTGANLNATLDDAPLRPWRSFHVRPGQRLALNAPASGVRGYLAAPGGFAAPCVLGSRATVVREKLGGLSGTGEPLRRGDLLTFASHCPPERSLDARWIPDYDQPARLTLLPGPRLSHFTGRSLFEAFNRFWQIDPRSDRMGVRLAGPALDYRGPGLISEGIPLGAIQVPPDGQPIILLNDRQTIGGYPCLGTLTPLAVARLAQCATGEGIELIPVGADAARRQHRQMLAQLASALPSSVSR